MSAETRTYADRLFGAHIPWCSHGDARALQGVAACSAHRMGDAEVVDQRVVIRQENVLRLDVPMDHAPTTVGVIQRPGHIERDLDRLRDRDPSVSLQATTYLPAKVLLSFRISSLEPSAALARWPFPENRARSPLQMSTPTFHSCYIVSPKNPPSPLYHRNELFRTPVPHSVIGCQVPTSQQAGTD